MKYTHRNYKGQYTAWAASRFGVAVLAGTIILSLAGWVERVNDPRCKGLFTPIACEDAFKITPPRVARAIEPTPEPELATVDEQKEIESYIKTVFGKQARTAIAVAKGECRGLRPECKLVTPREHSVCFFQVNLKAHADKVPGRTLAEKEKWLTSDHRHCTLIAKLIYDHAGGFGPWSAFTNGAYREHL
jgi:hypothetical protein